MSRTSKIAILASVAIAPLLSGAAFAQQGPAAEGRDVIVVTGTRVEDRSALDTAVAVDVVGEEALQNGGVSEINQALSVNLPSFNFPRPALTDGTDTIRPAALRGLAPDQTLVLVNSKRRHAASLVNVNGSIGRGSSAVDLNTIPTNMVQAVEVLRDGASAQYGSDAIAGVINVRLREANSGGSISASYGARDTTYDAPTNPATPAGVPITVPASISRDRKDGETTVVSGWAGFPLLTDNGFVTISAEYKQQAHTERPGLDTRQQYPLVAGAFDPREQTIDRFNAWTGEPQIEQATVFVNAGYNVSDDVELYGWGSWQKRESISAGFFRRAQDDRNVIQIYPNGFLPKINPTVTDISWAGGSRFQLGSWDMDASVVYGENRMEFTIRDTLNRSQGTASQTVFDAGGFEYDQVVANLSGVKQYNVGLASPLNVAAGVEWRREGYEIFAGEPSSYLQGGVRLASGAAAAPGAQVFPGFRPSNEVNKSRTAVGVYVDLEANITDAFLVSGAVRAEDYSDFGDTVTGKLAARYDFNDVFALRGSIQNGFRAPSPQQQYFATTSTNFISGVPFEVTTFPVSDPVARALGAQDLKAEESVNYSVGAVIRWGELSVTIDGYRIDVDDRIVLSENLGTTASASDAAVRAYLATQNLPGAAGRFFINGVDTETEGVDIVANYGLPNLPIGDIDLTFGANFSNTDVTRVPATPQLTALNPPPVLFGRVNVKTFEEGAPQDKYTFALDWKNGPFSALVRAIRYGEVLAPGAVAADDVVLSPKTVVDIEGTWAVLENLRFSVGADNVFDEYPDNLPARLNSTNNTPFTAYSPFGYSGRFVYARATLDF